MIETEIAVLDEKKPSLLAKWKTRKERINTKDQIFKIVLTGLLLALSVGISAIPQLGELKVNLLGANVPLRTFDVIIFAISIPLVGVWYSSLLGILEPWLHLLTDSDHPPIQMLFDNIANIIIVFSFLLGFYVLFNIRPSDKMSKKLLLKESLSGMILIPLNALIATVCFILTLIVINSTGTGGLDDYTESITAFQGKGAGFFFALFGIELVRFTIAFILFAIIQKHLSQVSRLWQK